MNSVDQIKTRIREFEGKRVQVVLSNNTAFYAKVKSVSENGIVVENGRLKKNLLPFNSIAEIYFDQPV